LEMISSSSTTTWCVGSHTRQHTSMTCGESDAGQLCKRTHDSSHPALRLAQSYWRHLISLSAAVTPTPGKKISDARQTGISLQRLTGSSFGMALLGVAAAPPVGGSSAPSSPISLCVGSERRFKAGRQKWPIRSASACLSYPQGLDATRVHNQECASHTFIARTHTVRSGEMAKGHITNN
jgi:hypothetical protein